MKHNFVYALVVSLFATSLYGMEFINQGQYDTLIYFKFKRDLKRAKNKEYFMLNLQGENQENCYFDLNGGNEESIIDTMVVEKIKSIQFLNAFLFGPMLVVRDTIDRSVDSETIKRLNDYIEDYNSKNPCSTSIFIDIKLSDDGTYHLEPEFE